MKLEEKNLIVKRSYKEVYKCEEGIVKVFAKEHPKSDVLNEGIEPTYLAWKASVLPLNYTRIIY